MSDTASLLTLPNPFPDEGGQLLLWESPGARRGELRQQLLAETYPRPFVLDDGERRYLYFNRRLMQSAMHKQRPHQLDLAYTRMMMAALLFLPRPRRIFLIGLGGGSLLKFCRAHLPGTAFTAVELDPTVLALRAAFAVPEPGDGLEIIEGDGAAVLADTEKGLDLLLVDAFDADGFAPGLANGDFLTLARDKLAGNGVLVINLAGEAERYADLIGLALSVFDEQVIVVPVHEDGNHVLFAFRAHHFEPRWRWLHNFAKELRARHGLDFPAFAQQLEKAARAGLAQKEARRQR